MRKLLVKIFNLVYIAAAVFAILSLCFEPLFKLSLDINIKNSDLVALVEKQNTDKGMIKREESSSNENFNVVEIVREIGDIETEEPLVVEIPAKVYFDFKNQEIIKNVIDENIEKLTLQLSKLLGPKMKTAIRTIAMGKAKNILSDQISLQIANYYKGEGTAPLAKEEDVNQIVENVYNLFNSSEETTTEALTAEIMGKRNYYVADPQPTSLEDLKADAYYYKVGDGTDEQYIRDRGEGDSFEDRTYYMVEFDTGVCSILKDLEGTEGFEKIDYDNIDSSSINNAMIGSLESMPGLTSTRYTLVADMTPEKFDAKAEDYYILDESNNYVLAEVYEEGKEYFIKEVIINNIDAAISGLMDFFFPSGETKEIIKRGEEPEPSSETPEEDTELDNKVQQLLKGLIKADVISAFADKTVTKYTPLICTGILVLFAFPWVWFALKTLIRTLRKRKCWCKFLVIFIFAFIQLILGAVITLGLRFGFTKILDVVAQRTTENAAVTNLVNLVRSCSIKIEFGCLMASYVYIGMAVTGIVYVIFAHRLKIDYKYDKKHAKKEKKAAKKAKRRANPELAK